VAEFAPRRGVPDPGPPGGENLKKHRVHVAEIIFANGGSATVTAPYQEACDSIQRRLLEHVDK
jgi:hypothetical protein